MHPVTSEYAYLSEMVPHHQEAIAAARLLQRSERPDMRRLGQSIVTTQTAEVGEMRGWLEQWYRQSPAPSPREATIPDLSGLSGAQLDKTFLQHMIPHHMMIVIAPTSRPPIDVHVTPYGRIIIPAAWPPGLDADDTDRLAE